MLALPVQGLAASTMLQCGPGHHMGQGEMNSMHAMHSMQAMPGQAAHDDASHEHHSNHAHDAPSSPDASSAKCSACASCCSAVAILGMVLPASAPVRHAAPAPILAVSWQPVFIAGPEKPPRAFLA